MHKLSLINFKAPFILLVSNSIPFLGANHHLVAQHVVVHDILELGQQCLLVDQIEEDQLVRRHLDSNVAPDEVDEPSVLHLVIQFPSCLAVD